MEDAGQDAAGDVAGAQHDRPGAVAKENAGRAILPVQQAAHGLGADDQGGGDAAGDDGLGGHAQGVDEAGAGRAQVKRAGGSRAQRVLDQAGRAGKDVLRRRCRHDDQVDLGGQHVGDLQRLARSGKAQGGGGIQLAGDAALPDAGAFPDPGVGCIDDGFQIVVGQHTLRKRLAPADDVSVVWGALGVSGHCRCICQRSGQRCAPQNRTSCSWRRRLRR